METIQEGYSAPLNSNPKEYDGRLVLFLHTHIHAHKLSKQYCIRKNVK